MKTFALLPIITIGLSLRSYANYSVKALNLFRNPVALECADKTIYLQIRTATGFSSGLFYHRADVDLRFWCHR